MTDAADAADAADAVEAVEPVERVVRASCEADWEATRAIRLRALCEAPTAFGSTYAHEQGFDEAAWRARAARPAAVLAFAGDEPVGIAGSYHDDELPPGTWEVVSMFVAPPHRGSGLAVRLIDATIASARDSGAERFALWVTETNSGARQRYLRYGFVETGERAPLPSDPSLAEIRMVLPTDDGS